MINSEARQNLAIVCASTGISLNEEQRDFAEDFTRPMFSISNAGTGKSTATCIGIINAQTYHRVPGKSINVMSYTKAATGEIRAKYENYCKRAGITPTANFRTFHSLCGAVVKRMYPTIKPVKEDVTRDFDDFIYLMDKVGFTEEQKADNLLVRSIYRTVEALGSELKYDELSVKNSCKFRKLDVDFDKFQNLRWEWFAFQLQKRQILQGYLPTFALWILLKNSDLVQEYRATYRIMVVDEFQDFGLLGLKVLSLLAKNLVVIGDRRQSIFKFAGAYRRIFEAYQEMYPTARQFDLTQSYRCCDEIADYANYFIKPYDLSAEPFKGVGMGGEVKEYDAHDLSVTDIVNRIKTEIKEQGFGRASEHMFLFRNNISSAAIIDNLWQNGVQVWCDKFKKINQLDLFKDLCSIVDATMRPGDFRVLNQLMYRIPEFKGFTEETNPLFMAMRHSRKNILRVPYNFRDDSTKELIRAMCTIYSYIQNGTTADKIFNYIMPAYINCCLGGESKWFRYYENEPSYYFNLVESITSTKDYPTLIAQEDRKFIDIKNNCNNRLGVRVYTAHSGKGLEAEVVYILDCDKKVFPKEKAMTEYKRYGCDIEAAEELINECNLLYVAVTRAKKEVIITHNGDITGLIKFPFTHEYSHLYEIYRNSHQETDDISAFLKLYRANDIKAATFLQGDTVTETEDFMEGVLQD